MAASFPSFSSFPDLGPGPSNHKSAPPSSEASQNVKRRKKRKRQEELEEPRKSLLKDNGWRTSSPEGGPRLFYSDRNGDILNIQYGGLYAGDVPKYRIAGGGKQILGLSNLWVATRRTGKAVEVGIRPRKHASLTDARSGALLSTPPTRRLLPYTSDAYEEIDGFIRISTSRGRLAPEDSLKSTTSGTANADFDSGTSTETEVEYDSDQSSHADEGALTLTSREAALKSLEQVLAVEPQLIGKWMSLLSHTLSTIPLTSKNTMKARADVTLSILSRAISAHPDNSSSEVLRLKYLKAGEEVWHESRLRSEWETALKLDKVELWIEWLEWKIRIATQGIDVVVESALRAMSAFVDDERGDFAKIRVFWRTAVALRSAGFSERATAMFQAQAELLYAAPHALAGASLSTKLNELGEFWDSEVPRFGEKAAAGWATWVSQGRPDHTITAKPSKEVGGAEDLDPYRQWAAQELQADGFLILPTRSGDDFTDSDPYSTVLFSDIRDLLQNIQSVHGKRLFRLVWLSFLGLYLPGLSLSISQGPMHNWDDRWNSSHMTQPTYLNSVFPGDTNRDVGTDLVAGVVVGREKSYADSFGPIKNWGLYVLGPLDDPAPRRSKRESGTGLWDKRDVCGVDQDFIRRIFQQLRNGNDDREWICLELAFESSISVKGALRQSKTFLSVCRDSILQWTWHAQLECKRDRFSDARKIFQTVLIAGEPSTTQLGVGQMWWNWAEMEWLSGDEEEALNVMLTSAGAGLDRSGMTVLRAKRSLEDAARWSENEECWKDQESWIKLRALLELVVGKDTNAAVVQYDSWIAQVDAGKAMHESLIVACLLMLYNFGKTLKNPLPPAVLRKRATTALQQYPSNSIILAIFLEGEKGQGLWGKIRGILGASDGTVKDVVRRVMEVWIAGWEKGRWVSEIERTRSGLSAAVEHERTRGSPVIWRIFVEFEMRAGELQRAKKTLFRAIGECPLVKDLYLLAFGPLRSVFQGHELNALADTMVERGLRLRKGLDEVVELWKVEDDEEICEQSDDPEDEIFNDAEELRRLKPY